MGTEKKYCIIYRPTTYALSGEQGIFISSSAFDGPQAMSGYAWITPEGEVESEIFDESMIMVHKKWKEENSTELQFVGKATNVIMSIIVAILCTIFVLIRGPFSLAVAVFTILSMFTRFLFEISYCLALTLYNVKYPSLKRFHGAEHMAIQAAEKYGRVPSIEEIASCSIFDNRCTTIRSILKPVLNTFLRTILLTYYFVECYRGVRFLVENLQEYWIWAISALAILGFTYIVKKVVESGIPAIVNFGFEKGFLTSIMQRIFVAKPGINELKVAQEAILLKYVMDEDIKSDPDGYQCEKMFYDIEGHSIVKHLKNGKYVSFSMSEYIDYIEALIKAKIEGSDDEDADSDSEDDNADL